MSLEERAARINNRAPDLIADVMLYPTENGGRELWALPGWGCPTMISRDKPLVGWDACPQLGGEPLRPGETRRLGFVFLSPEGAETMRQAGKFYLWEGRFIGEATVVSSAA